LPAFTHARAGTSSGAFGEWGFKATKQLVKLTCRAGRVGDMLARYADLLVRINRGDVTRNRAEKVRPSLPAATVGVPRRCCVPSRREG
jgi:hypothetical protein